MYKGILITKDDTGYMSKVAEITPKPLQEGEVSVQVKYSTLNYKDALAITGRSPVVRSFPLTPGIDFSGVVIESKHPAWKEGDEVILNGWGGGEKYSGGLAEQVTVSGDWLIQKPITFSFKDTMIIGTAGYTAMLCVMALQKHGIKPSDGKILVTGANGGVGSIAIIILSHLGYEITASTGRPQESEYLTGLGATEIIDRAELSSQGKPLNKEIWAGVIDTVGSYTLANACASTKYRGAVAACGLAGGMDFPATVAPFILRGITLYGVDSVMAPIDLRKEAWERLAKELDKTKLDTLTTEIQLSEAIHFSNEILDGKVRGRVVVKL
ncbi:oxidoreductase [Acinetobacter bereziniae]|uniref:acrylyl-CoA reductase (NADPH) n=1 Tax=Acinetobacter bereziniae TaxID=106648 RepID=UPI0021CD85CF|nr:MDR family oxidoreductase [Acinetobacter bereziniae]MCU4539214.1 oxidoreductase [Acinetobacter bereziniae]